MKDARADIVSLALKKNDWPLQELDGLVLVRSPLLSAHAGLIHAFTTRHKGASPSPLDSFNLGRQPGMEASWEDAKLNRQRLCRVLSLDFERLVVPGQVHSANVAWVSERKVLAEVDGCATNHQDLPLLLHFADCVPIILFEPETRVLAVVHAGWRGTALGIARQAAQVMVQKGHAQLERTIAAIGPAIGSCCYPTGMDVVEKLSSTISDPALFFFRHNGQVCPDLKAINAQQLLELGVGLVDVTSFCTACRPEVFYSHRQSGGLTGRQGAIACLSGG